MQDCLLSNHNDKCIAISTMRDEFSKRLQGIFIISYARLHSYITEGCLLSEFGQRDELPANIRPRLPSACLNSAALFEVYL